MRISLVATALALLMVAPAQSHPAGRSLRAHPARARIAVRSHVTVHHGTVMLSDLLPDSSPRSLRAEAGQLSLGSSPQPPMTRIIYRQQLQYLLRGHAPLLSELSLPPQVAIERFCRAVTQAEVASAIERALGGDGSGEAAPLNLRDVRFSTPVYVTGNDAGLRVLRIAADPLRHETRFRLWTSKDPGNLPFTVTAPQVVKLPALVARHALAPGELVSATDFAVVMRPGEAGLSPAPAAIASLAGLETRAFLRPGQPVDRNDFAPPVLVRPEALATLIVRDRDFSIETIVTPLEQGVLGQEIKVRNIETRRVVEAKVVGRDRLLKTR